VRWGDERVGLRRGWDVDVLGGAPWADVLLADGPGRAMRRSMVDWLRESLYANEVGVATGR